jgi:prepilin-type processing-associated H-X9-DG protein
MELISWNSEWIRFGYRRFRDARSDSEDVFDSPAFSSRKSNMVMVITGFGTAVPDCRISQTDAYQATMQLCCDSDEHRRVMELIYQGSGVLERGTVLLSEAAPAQRMAAAFLRPRSDGEDRGPTTQDRMDKYEEHALILALESAEAALAQADQDLSEITHLVTVSCSGFHAPGFDIGLIQTLGLSPETARTHVGFMGCHGSFNALRVAKAFIEADPRAVVLVCSVELCSLHHHYGWSTDKVIANALFADGSAAVVCRSASPGQLPAHAKYQLIRSGSHVIPQTTGAMSWRIGDHGFEMTLSQKVPALIEQHLHGWMTEFLAKERLTPADVRGWAIHPGGPRILDACLTALALSGEAVATAREILAEYGNMSSATILFLLDRLIQQPLEGPVVAVGFGPGLTIEAMLLHT